MLRLCALRGADLREQRSRVVLAVKVTSMRMPHGLDRCGDRASGHSYANGTTTALACGMAVSKWR
jgi:hypothetical protein